MKNTIMKTVKLIASFIKAHTAITIATASVIAVTAVAVPVGIYAAKNNSIDMAPSSPSDTEQEVEIIEEQVVIENEASEPVASEPAAEEPTAEEPATEQPATSKQEGTASSQPTTQSSAPKPATTPTQTENKSNVKVVQRANTDTGMSWDGVSPIIYTYPDGTTGTEKRDGATYESLPGMITTVNISFETSVSDYDGTCPHCGKKESNGTNGTCIRPLGDMICTGCGKELPAGVCHTCGQ